ncbi:hypothetical protein ACET3Z_021455 [Daucus carota]
MRNTPLYPKYGTEDSHDFDPQLDFAVFLMEARNYEFKLNNIMVDQLSALGNAGQSDEGLKRKKSWRNSFLFSWLKAEKKGNKCSRVETEPSEKSCSVPTLRRGHSGPMFGKRGRTGSNTLWRQNSGPLTSLFKRTEEQMPYICLDKLNSNFHAAESYGPVYLVT